MDAQGIALFLAGLAVVALAWLFKAKGFGDPEKLWVEFVVAVVIAYLSLVGTGQLPLFPDLGKIPFGDPLAFLAAVGNVLAQLGEFWSKIFALAVVVFEYFKKQLVASAMRIRAG